MVQQPLTVVVALLLQAGLQNGEALLVDEHPVALGPAQDVGDLQLQGVDLQCLRGGHAADLVPEGARQDDVLEAVRLHQGGLGLPE